VWQRPGSAVRERGHVSDAAKTWRRGASRSATSDRNGAAHSDAVVQAAGAAESRVLEREAFPVLLVAGGDRRRAAARTIERIVSEVEKLGHVVVEAETMIDGLALALSDPSFGCVVVDWLDADDGVQGFVEAVRRRNARVPLFLMLERADLADIGVGLGTLAPVQEYVFVFEETASFVAGRIDYAWRRYTETLLPPFFRQLVQFTESHEYSWHTPGHAGGTAFRKSPVGKAFYDFYGETLFRTDLSVSVGELGSLLDHSGAVGEAERAAARIFGADFSMFVLNGTSTANQVVAHSCITPGDLVLADRNCHKSLNYALAITGGVPDYLLPVRNGYGIIGPIPPARLSRDAIAARAGNEAPVYAVVTNSTYDGLCYDVRRVVDLLGESVPRLHFDEAWYAYARFNPLYADRYAMHDRDGGPTIYATQSTHKLLAAFSQASMIHVRDSERAPVRPELFNEAYMMHASTSPFYPMIAALDVSAAMMDGAGGRWLIEQSIRDAIHFRKRMVAVAQELGEQGLGWFFGVWQPDEVRDPGSGVAYSFLDAPDELLAREPSCWMLDPGDRWHGFDDLEPGYCMLDPIKVTLTTPGVDAAGVQSPSGIPAYVVSRFLDERRVEVEKTGDYAFLVLFSLGTTLGKWGTLLEGLLEFKRAYDTAAPLAETLPSLVADHPARYGSLTLRDLCDEMHDELVRSAMPVTLDEAFGELPETAATPAETYRLLVRGQTEKALLSDLADDRIAGVMVVPYPPGIPLLMPGERVGAADGPFRRYLRALEDFDRRFPGFEHDIHGIERRPDGRYFIECVKEDVL
jgi:arginine decarboxylase